MENQEVLKITWKKGVKEVKPVHQMVQNWMFTEETEELATLAHYMAVVAEKMGYRQMICSIYFHRFFVC